MHKCNIKDIHSSDMGLELLWTINSRERRIRPKNRKRKLVQHLVHFVKEKLTEETKIVKQIRKHVRSLYYSSKPYIVIVCPI